MAREMRQVCARAVEQGLDAITFKRRRPRLVIHVCPVFSNSGHSQETKGPKFPESGTARRIHEETGDSIRFFSTQSAVFRNKGSLMRGVHASISLN